ncbi:MAG TPA: 2-dehydropantoate 2-reductase N-terminal domain-containing protein, partial [Casimicrobiaceae bacterium]
MRVCIYGAGAIGTLIGAWLGQAGQRVSVVARGASESALRAHGMRVVVGDAVNRSEVVVAE